MDQFYRVLDPKNLLYRILHTLVPIWAKLKLLALKWHALTFYEFCSSASSEPLLRYRDELLKNSEQHLLSLHFDILDNTMSKFWGLVISRQLDKLWHYHDACRDTCIFYGWSSTRRKKLVKKMHCTCVAHALHWWSICDYSCLLINIFVQIVDI